MCDPISATLVATSVGSNIAGFVGARQQAKAQLRYQAQAAAAERQRFQQEQTSIRMREQQEQEATAREMNQLQLRTRQAISRTKENPYAEALADDYLRQEGAVRSALLGQQELGQVATGMALEQAGFATTQRQIGIAQPVSKPSALVAGLQTISGGLGALGTGMDISSRLKGGGGGTAAPQSYTQAMAGRRR
jgi:hypothetical protein